MPLTVTFAAACARPGTMQTITIKTVPESGTAYEAVYADGKQPGDPDYPGGNNGGVTDQNGKYEDSWIVGLTAVPGPVEVQVLVATVDASTSETFTFAIAGRDGRC